MRWVELGHIPALTSHDMVTWFHENITCQFGLPCMVRFDHGSEYWGEFNPYMQANGVHHHFISTEHPRGNGLVEQQNRIIKAAICKFLAHYPAGC